jgi:uncharacterized protein YodC (DUF2158 family)
LGNSSSENPDNPQNNPYRFAENPSAVGAAGAPLCSLLTEGSNRQERPYPVALRFLLSGHYKVIGPFGYSKEPTVSDKFAPGDVVHLKSGGPLMTVESANASGVTCTWFDDKKNLKNARFPEAILEKYDESAIAALQLG